MSRLYSLAMLLHNTNDICKGVMIGGMRKKVRNKEGSQKESNKKEIRQPA
jgi:hypothetical protein